MRAPSDVALRSFAALRFPRPVAVLLVYLLFGLTFIAAGVLAGTVIATQAQSASTVVQKEFSTAPGQTETPAQQKLDRLQRWLNHHHLHQITMINHRLLMRHHHLHHSNLLMLYQHY